MTAYAIGDLQGCEQEFLAMLQKLDFSSNDTLWLLGDLINRGPDSLGTLRRIMGMSEQCRVVLGNHDLHFLVAYYGKRKPSRTDTFGDILAAPDVAELAAWLRQQPLLYLDKQLGYVMTHAGIPHVWSIDEAAGYAREVERILRGEDPALSYKKFFAQMYGNEPARWDKTLTGMSRARLITNYFTRLRLVDKDGTLDFAYKGTLENVPQQLYP
jgi:bis(5'-nucleosyl)-tetraphosphatase (symmetrical)